MVKRRKVMGIKDTMKNLGGESYKTKGKLERRREG